MSKRDEVKFQRKIEEYKNKIRSASKEFDSLPPERQEEMAKQYLERDEKGKKPCSRAEVSSAFNELNRIFRIFDNDIKGMWAEFSVLKEMLFEKNIINIEDFKKNVTDKIKIMREAAKEAYKNASENPENNNSK